LLLLTFNRVICSAQAKPTKKLRLFFNSRGFSGDVVGVTVALFSDSGDSEPLHNIPEIILGSITSYSFFLIGLS